MGAEIEQRGMRSELSGGIRGLTVNGIKRRPGLCMQMDHKIEAALSTERSAFVWSENNVGILTLNSLLGIKHVLWSLPLVKKARSCSEEFIHLLLLSVITKEFYEKTWSPDTRYFHFLAGNCNDAHWWFFKRLITNKIIFKVYGAFFKMEITVSTVIRVETLMIEIT